MMMCFFCKHKTAYEVRISDWSSDVCSSDLAEARQAGERLHRRVEMREALTRDIFGDRDRLKPVGQSRRHRPKDIETRRIVAGQCGVERIGDMAHALHDRQDRKSVV